MDKMQLVALMEKVINQCNHLVRKEGGLFISTNFCPDEDMKPICFKDETIFLIGVHEGSFVLYKLRDVMIEELEHNASDLLSSGGRFILDNWNIPDDVDKIAQRFCLRTQDRITNYIRLALHIDFSVVNELSARPYEKDVCRGSLLFLDASDKDHTDILSVRVADDQEICYSEKDLRQLRKLLQGAGKSRRLVFEKRLKENGTQPYVVRGYAEEIDYSNIGWEIDIKGTLDWNFSRGRHVLFGMKNNHLIVPQDEIELAYEGVCKEFPSLVGVEQQIKDQIRAVGEQDHGSTLIYLNMNNCKVKEWIDELYKNLRCMKMALDSPHKLKEISMMDGAILIDVSCKPDLIGKVIYSAAIVDGRAIVPGMLERGARHNSTYTFIANLSRLRENEKDEIACALVFSEDGGITVFRAGEFQF